MTILVTGGAGYIGSHTAVQLLESGCSIVVVDNLVNSCEESLRRVKKITEKDFPFYQVDLLDQPALARVFDENQIDAVIHFAGLKAVGESVGKPLEYYHNNITGTLILCDEMRKHGCKKLIFSSSATVYGKPDRVPVTEEFSLSTINPYGTTKLFIERILTDLSVSDPGWSIVLLRYFNPIGAHESGLIGDNPNGIPNNLMPYVTQVAIGKLPGLSVYGNDYATPDGTCIRDYIHVMDLADGHVKALGRCETAGVFVYNLGTGKGYSVLDIIHAFEDANHIHIPYTIGPRRPGDADEVYGDVSKAQKELGWNATRGLAEMCRDSWNWQQKNPNGFGQ